MYLVAVFPQNVTPYKGMGKLNYDRHISTPIEEHVVLICIRFLKLYKNFQQQALYDSSRSACDPA